MTDPVITAIVVAFDSAHVLPDCLAALAREGVPVIVVDNGSSDGSAALAESRGARVIRNGRNEGFGRAMNIGVRAAETPFCLLTNPDLVYEPGAVAALLEAAERWPDAGLLAPRIIEPDGRFFWQARSLLSPYLKNPSGKLSLPEGDCCAPFLSGASLLVRRDVFLSHGRVRSRHLPVLRGRRSLPPHGGERPRAGACARSRSATRAGQVDCAPQGQDLQRPLAHGVVPWLCQPQVGLGGRQPVHGARQQPEGARRHAALEPRPHGALWRVGGGRVGVPARADGAGPRGPSQDDG